MDAYFRGYDCIALQDCIATTSPPGGLENVIYNTSRVRTSRPQYDFGRMTILVCSLMVS